MFGALIKTALEARAQRELLLAEAASQRQRMAVYLGAFDPAVIWVERLFSAVRMVLDRPVIPAAVIAAVIVLKPRRAIRVARLAWKAFSWIRRVKALLGESGAR